MHWVLAIVTLVVIFVMISNYHSKKRWSKILGYKPNLDELMVIIDLESVKCPQDEIIQILQAFNSKMLDKKTIKEIIKEKKQKIKQKELEEKEAREQNEYKQLVYENNATIGRTADIIYQSLHIAIDSKKLDTIESRIRVAKDKFEYIKEQDDYFAETIQEQYKELLKKANTAKYTNVAQAYFDKYKTLKSQNSKEKYYNMAKEHLKNGLKDFTADQNKIHQKYQELFDDNFQTLPKAIAIDTIDSNNYPVGTTDEMIDFFEIGDFDSLRELITKMAYTYAGTPESEMVKNIGKFFAKHDPIYSDILTKVKDIVSTSQGIKQSIIYKDVSPDGFYSDEEIRYVLYYAAEYGDIIREPFGNSYKLYTV
ncbi:hypothetical protein CCAL13119_08910 [Campylobacter sp. RM13119]|uniref:hypothetical protein n=1 Tax=Campylobacter TaxID=194 RepID=UPI0014763F83|nr:MULTISPECIES: hypothetical protein [unclassified Campylobacter]MBE3607042.1 hypothetical protein [Campylobacter sp. RM13119]